MLYCQFYVNDCNMMVTAQRSYIRGFYYTLRFFNANISKELNSNAYHLTDMPNKLRWFLLDELREER